MIYELRCYTLNPGKLSDFLTANRTIGRPARGQNFGTNCGYWTSEFGSLNQVWHLWKYDSYEERVRLRRELSAYKPWIEEYLPAIHSLIARQDLRLMNSVLDFPADDDTSGNIYELRVTRMEVGKIGPFAKSFAEGKEQRKNQGPLLGAWTVEFPQPNEWVDLLRYRDLDQRAEVMADPGWRSYFAKDTSVPVEMHASLLLPTDFSPLR